MNKKVFKISQDFTFHCQSEWNNKKINKYRTVGIIPKSNIKIVERGKIDTPDSEGRLRTKLSDKRDDFNFPIVNFLFIFSNIPQMFHNGQPSHGGDRKIFEVMTRWSVASLLAATLYQGNPDRNHKLWNIVSTERYMLHVQVLLECCYI
jgi:hypothetical protein